MTNPEEVNLSGVDTERAAYAALVRHAASGSPDAMEQLLMRAQEAAYRVSLLVCGHTEDAEDNMQEALVKTYRYIHRIKDPEAFRTWLYRTVRNACLMKRRRRVGEPARFTSVEQGAVGGDGEPVSIDVVDKGRSVDQQMIDAVVGKRLGQALDRLPPDYRVIVVLREIEGLSTREVAGIAGISEANVKTRLHRARQMLRQSLEDL